MDRGIVLTGGGAMLHGMDALIEQKTGVSTLTVQDAMLVVAAEQENMRKSCQGCKPL